ncbi:MAG: universal stress protein [Dehalococcoidia bacterium]|jgi:nucleotide-binding universal stress UspA family protein
MLLETAPLLVPLDGSMPAEKALRVAEAIAELQENDIQVLYVSPRPLTAEETAARLNLGDEWQTQITLINATGDPAETIRRIAWEIHAGAILMSSHGEGGNLDEPAGHVTLHVLQNPPCPVFVLRSALDAGTQVHRLQHLRRILIPLDGNFESTLSVEEASILASRSNARLLMLHVVDSNPETARAPASPVFLDDPRHELEAWQDEFLRSSFAVAGVPRNANMVVALRVGDPGEEIIRYAADSDCDLLIASWKGRLSPGRARVVQMLLERATFPLLFLVARARNGETNNHALPLARSAGEARQSRAS